MRRAAVSAVVLALAPAFAAAPAAAHGLHGDPGTALAGFLHPLLGPDHVLAMVAVGLWAGIAGGRARWIWPAAFVGAMLAGYAAGLAAGAVPLVEPAILASVIALGLLAALALRLPVAAGAVVAAAFAVAHGLAHGAEAPAGDPALYAAGFALATALLHLAGIAIVGIATGKLGHGAARLAGWATALGGLWLASGA